VPKGPLTLDLFNTRLGKHFVHVLDWDRFLICFKCSMRVIFLCRVEIIGGFLLGLGFFFPEVFHGVLEVFDFFSELIFVISGDKFELIFLFLYWVSEHIKFLPVLINTLVEGIFLNFIDNGRDVRLNVIPHIKNLFKILIQIIHLNMCKLDVLFFFLTQII
jgi:hypothetical protein